MNMLPKCEANYTALTPTTFLKRAAAFYANRTSVIYEGTSFTWGQTYDRCCRLASSLLSLNIVKHDVVSVFPFSLFRVDVTAVFNKFGDSSIVVY